METLKIMNLMETYFQLTVRRDEANALIYAWSLVNESYDLYPREVILPDGVHQKN